MIYGYEFTSSIVQCYLRVHFCISKMFGSSQINTHTISFKDISPILCSVMIPVCRTADRRKAQSRYCRTRGIVCNAGQVVYNCRHCFPFVPRREEARQKGSGCNRKRFALFSLLKISSQNLRLAAFRLMPM